MGIKMATDLLTIDEAAGKLRLSTKTIRRMLTAKRLPGAFRVGAGRGRWRIPTSALKPSRERRETERTQNGASHKETASPDGSRQGDQGNLRSLGALVPSNT